MKIADIINEAEVMQKVGSIPVIKVKNLPSGEFDASGKTEHRGEGIQTVANLHKKTGKIIKHTRLSSLEDPVLQFINICMFNSNNPWLPTYDDAKIYYNDRSYLLLSTSEALSGRLDDWRKDAAKEKMMGSVQLSAVGEQTLAAKRGQSTGDREYAAKAQYLTSLLKDIDPQPDKQLRKIKTFYDDTNLHKAVDILAQFKEKVFDLHSGNFMWDKNNHLVINDPVHDGGDDSDDWYY